MIAENATRGTVLASRLRRAHTFWKRVVGLLGRAALPPGEGLWLRPCQQIHMVGMRFPLDVVFLDAEGCVVRMVGGLRPFAVSPRVRTADGVLELPVGTITATGTAVGDRVALRPVA